VGIIIERGRSDLETWRRGRGVTTPGVATDAPAR